ncbi:unnamed protein product [Cuscuta epithymum]|uniref:Uncharacterized protein n=1 Tax=Cuscuta epithymum TaxID=186058 RepID=A0AAV0D9S7_9ASTE|nr:unnamed protein product [Cuscuta epithymum]
MDFRSSNQKLPSTTHNIENAISLLPEA